ncbi:hypothetical protein [Burkholderia ubonensis]|uniref:hypothetical protein n=1 Tax=Burkholderia ubonensis TaxID=101571 RepID=UPI0007568047|nr:hypothetical protein [Burkholderia ubonensis]KVS39298.1 hypothetical protein WK38_03760 [Burkholderia ubonensis]KVS46211.1 hypothetical protein WK37_11570 [Burkholderia ubonensis]KVS78890.1 hypothetical protein WK42_15450 [Burkholderia ubonensis]KVS80659.1 hypothetical protein WK44_29415 [Burkholderia ubonensis]KVS85652.1 hypothetical protein WK43_21955 [Burkholderia ubonensis]
MTILISVVGTVILLAVASPRLMRAWCKELPGGTRASARGSHTLRHPHDTVRDAAREAARFAALDARAADACATELERLASAGSTRAASERAADDFPSTLARKQLVRERARKAREHATRARAHAGAARSVLQRDARHDDDSLREDELRRHACLANQAHLNARDLLEFTLASEKRSDL